jgi:hypothetical protein
MKHFAEPDFLTEIDVKAKQHPLLILYCETKSERLLFVCNFIFERVLRATCSITDDPEEFASSSKLKINYSHTENPNAVQVLPSGLLTESKVFEKKPGPVFIDDQIYFYKCIPETATSPQVFHFDVFSAVFYFISRYEEWQQFTKDKHGRFEASESLLFKNKVHLKPVVDFWINEFKDFIVSHNPELPFIEKKFTVVSTIDVDNLYAYRHKGVWRSFGGGLKDLLKLDFKNFAARIKVISGREKDPFDIYEEIADFCSQNKIPLIYFFLLRSGTPFDRTVHPGSPAFKKVFELIDEKKVKIGLHPSYHAAFEPDQLSKELALLSGRLGRTVNLSRQHFLRFDIRTTPNLLLQNGLLTDFSMGFASTPGFRAGTSNPFYYFDFSKEKASELLFVPFCTMDGAYFVYNTISPETAFESMMSLAQEIKKVGGFFISVFHERTFSNHLYPGFGTLYKKLHQHLNQL